MGYSHERGAAVRTILRMRAIGDQAAIEDAGTASSGYLDMDEFDINARYHVPDGLPANDPVIRIKAEVQHYRTAAIANESDITDILAKALGYPLFMPGEPGYSDDRENYVTGDHTAASLAREAAARIAEMEKILDDHGL